MNVALLQEIDEAQRLLERWYQQSSAQLHAGHSSLVGQLRALEERITGESSGSGPLGPGTISQHLSMDAMMTPNRPILSDDRLSSTPALSSPPGSHPPMNYDNLLDEVTGKGSGRRLNLEADAGMCRRPGPKDIKGDDLAGTAEVDGPCQVLVEFKRKRIRQYESPFFVAPGEHVVVAADRGEDVGMVTHCWSARDGGSPMDRLTGAEEVGKILRIANMLEVTQLQGVQTELESRAVEVAQEKVQEHGLPMRIVDAEYQFDRRKLTFYYQSQHRLDFRNLVRDLYKTFRARIWMEQDVTSP